MSSSVSVAAPDVLGRERMVRHGFADRPATSVVEAVGLTTAIQAQDVQAARLGVRSRSTALTDAHVNAAVADRSVVRTWLMRSTIHLVTAADARWLVAAFGPMIRRRFARRWTELGLTPEVLLRAEGAVADVLRAGPLTRHEVVAGLRQRGIDVDRSGQAPTHLMVHLATVGLTCHAEGDRFALLDDWLPGSPDGPRGDEALVELGRRYFRAFSPATAADFTAWSGLPSSVALSGLRDELTPVDVHGRRGFRLGEVAPGSGVRLLAAFDNYLVGYRDRDAIIAAEHRPDVYVGGMIRPAILLDGRVIGRWRVERSSREVVTTLYGPVSRAVRAAVDVERADVTRFLTPPA